MNINIKSSFLISLSIIILIGFLNIARIECINKFTNDGLVFWKKGEIKDAVENLKFASSLGGVTASYTLYKIYSKKDSYLKDKEKSLFYLKKNKESNKIIDFDYKNKEIDDDFYMFYKLNGVK